MYTLRSNYKYHIKNINTMYFLKYFCKYVVATTQFSFRASTRKKNNREPDLNVCYQTHNKELNPN